MYSHYIPGVLCDVHSLNLWCTLWCTVIISLVYSVMYTHYISGVLYDVQSLYLWCTLWWTVIISLVYSMMYSHHISGVLCDVQSLYLWCTLSCTVIISLVYSVMYSHYISVLWTCSCFWRASSSWCLCSSSSCNFEQLFSLQYLFTTFIKCLSSYYYVISLTCLMGGRGLSYWANTMEKTTSQKPLLTQQLVLVLSWV